jgi:DNA-binding protein HU-beta
MTRRELIDRVMVALPEGKASPALVGEVIEQVFEAIASGLAEEGKYTHPSFGTFTVKVQHARMGLDPRTGAAIVIAEGATVGFKAAPALKGRVQR